MSNNIDNQLLHIIETHGPLSSQQILATLKSQYNICVNKETVNSLLYGQLRGLVIRDKNEKGYPVWRIKRQTFEAAMGLEVLFYDNLLRQKIVTEENSRLDYKVRNPRNNKTYHLDIAIFHGDKKTDIEIDGFEHMRADAMLSIQNQIVKKGDTHEIEIDWMDNGTSYVDFKLIDSGRVFKWCTSHRDWCMKYHEELIKPHDITRNVWLIENRWKIIRFWNFEVKNEMDRCIQVVKDVLF